MDQNNLWAWGTTINVAQWSTEWNNVELYSFSVNRTKSHTGHRHTQWKAERQNATLRRVSRQILYRNNLWQAAVVKVIPDP